MTKEMCSCSFVFVMISKIACGLRSLIERREKLNSFPAMELPFSFRDSHEEFVVFDWDPAREYFHGVLEIAV